MYVKPEKGAPFEQSPSVHAIIGSNPLPPIASRAQTYHFVWCAVKKLEQLSFHLEQLFHYFRALQTHCVQHNLIIHAKACMNQLLL